MEFILILLNGKPFFVENIAESVDLRCFFLYTISMILFYLKKNFCDGWDSLLWIALFNICLLAWTAIGFFAVSAVINLPLIYMIVIVVFICGAMVLLFSLSDACSQLANYKSFSISEVFSNIKNVWKIGMLFGLLISFLLFTVLVGLPFYFQMYNQTSNLLYLFLSTMIFWILLLSIFALQWFLPLQSQLGGGFKKNLKKCFIMFFDNVGFSVFLGIYSLFIFVFSGVLAFMAPGITGIVLAQNNALRLRLYKYDWLEEHSDLSPKEARKQIPWDELIAEDRETLGPRDLKSFIFPWK